MTTDKMPPSDMAEAVRLARQYVADGYSEEMGQLAHALAEVPRG